MKQFPSLLRCRLSRKQLVRLLTPVLAFAPIVNAADVSKANNVDALNLDTSWTSGALPTATDVAVFDSTVTDIPEDGTTGFRLMSFPVAASWQGIRVVGAVDKLSIDSFGLGLPALTIGSAGIDLSSALTGTTFDLFGQAITLGAPQTWRVADGATLSIGGGSLARAAGANLEIVLGTGAIKFESGNLGTYATLNDTHYAGVDAVTKLVVPATYADYASGGNLAGTYTGILNVTGTTTGATQAWRQSNSFTVSSGVRFGQNNTQNTRWTVDTSTGGRVITTPSILVGSAVTQNIEFNGSGGIRAAASASELLIQNFGSGTVIFNTIINNPTTGSHALTKIGPGGLTIASNSGYNGATRINEGVFQIGNGGATGDIGDASAVTVNTSLVFNRTGVLAFPNTITGSGSLSLAGSGEIQLTGANSFAGPVGLGGGTLTFSNTGNLGAGTALNFTGGALRWAAGNTTDISATHTLAFGLGGAIFDTNGANITLANSMGNSGAGGLTKVGAGVLTLTGANLYTGATNLSAGGLVVNNTTGSATGSGNVSLANGTTLSGSGSIAGTTTVTTGAKLTPGNAGVGTLTTGGLALNAGALLDLDFDSTTSYDKLVVANSDGLSINGGGILLYTAGGTSAWATPGTYDLIQYSGTLGGTGVSTLNVLNNQPGYSYTFSADGALVKLQIALDSVLTQWTATAGGSWDNAANWSNGVAANNYTAQFTTDLGAPATITLDGARFANGLSFTSSAAYTIAAGSGGSLTLERSAGNVGATVTAGDHVISAPVVLNTTLAAATSSATSLTLSGVVSGVGGVVKSGPGTLDLTGANTFTGAVNVVGGVLGFAQEASLGTAALTLDGGTLRYDVGNTADISAKTINFGFNGATVDTNGNAVTFANPVGNAGVGSFTKAGLGTLSLAGANTYTGQTIVTGGTLAFTTNANLGVESVGAGVTLNGGALAPTATVALDNAGANARALTIGANGGELNVATGQTLTVGGVVAGSGTLTKTGAGDLLVTGANAGLTGAVTIAAGNIRLGNNAAVGQGGLGSAAITFGDGAHLYLNGYQTVDNGTTSFGVLANALVVPTGVTGNLHLPQRGGYSGVVTGAGTLNLSVDAIRGDVNGVWPAFTGQLNIVKTPTGEGTDVDDYRLAAAQNLSAAKVNIGAGVRVNQIFNPPADAVGTTHQFGELTVDAGAILGGNPVGARYNNYSIGALGTDSVINGQIVGFLGTFGYGYPRITKVGAGKLTINGTSHMINTGATTDTITVNAGTLNLLGSIERFYLGIGVDGVYGRDVTSTLTDDTISNTPPATDYQNVEPGAMVVADGATLSGNGRFGGVTTVNGILRPDPTGTLEGQLAFTNVATLTLGATSVTQFDFAANKFTGVRVDATNGLTYGGALKINFLSTVQNGSYTLFQITGSPAGAFTGVSVVADSVETALTDAGGGIYSATVGSVTYTFTAATGVFGVSGAGPTFTALQNWRFEQFGVYNDDGTVLAGDTEDFDGDGMVNILEYALDTNPKVVNASPVVVGRSGNFLTLSYPRKATADVALSYTVEGTTALDTTAFATGTGATNTVGTTSTYTDDVNLTTNPRRFLRLSVNYTAPTP
jgi:autotransporter-associated beta strand protein